MYTQDDLKNLSDEDKKKKRHSVQMEIIMLESDLKKFYEQKAELDAEIRKITYEEEKLRIIKEEKKGLFEKIKFDISQNEADIKRFKKQLNLIS